MNPEERVKVDERDGQGLGKDEIVEQTGLSRAQVGAYLGRKHRKEISGDAREAVRETGKAVEMAAEKLQDDGLKRDVIRILGDVLELLKKLT